MWSDFHCPAAVSVGEMPSVGRPIAWRCWFTSCTTWPANVELSVPHDGSGEQFPTAAAAGRMAIAEAATAARASAAAAKRTSARERRRFSCILVKTPLVALRAATATHRVADAKVSAYRTIGVGRRDPGAVPDLERDADRPVGA